MVGDECTGDNEDLWPFGPARAIVRIPRAAVVTERLRLYPPVAGIQKAKSKPRWWFKVLLKKQSEDRMHV